MKNIAEFNGFGNLLILKNTKCTHINVKASESAHVILEKGIEAYTFPEFRINNIDVRTDSTIQKFLQEGHVLIQALSNIPCDVAISIIGEDDFIQLESCTIF